MIIHYIFQFDIEVIVDPPGHGRIGGHYFYVRPSEKKNDLQR